MNNYHTHTYLCRHAEGAAAAYARKALEHNMNILGISDHTPLPGNRWPEVRMAMSELEEYEEQIETARREVPEIIILKGLECEWDPSFHSFLRDEILGQRRFDYLIGAEHYFKYHGEWHELGKIHTASHLRAYADILIKTMESGLFAFIAHPDGFGSGYDAWDENAASCSRDIIQAAAELDVPLEINGYGFRKTPKETRLGPRLKYPLPEFWELASSYPVRVICNSDAHRPEDVAESIDEAREIAARCNLQVIDEITVKEPVGEPG